MVATVGHYGFSLLNSDANEQFNEKQDELIARALTELNDERLTRLRCLEIDGNNNGEESIPASIDAHWIRSSKIHN